MKTIEMLIIVACIALVVALFAWAAARIPKRTQVIRGYNSHLRRKTLRYRFPFWENLRRTFSLLPILFAHWRSSRTASVEFANVGEGTHAKGIKSYIPDAATTSRYLMYKGGSDADHCAVTGAGDIPLGSSDDLADSAALDVPIAIKLFGAVEGTVRIISDGTLTNLCKVTTGANGQGTAAVTTNLVVGVAIIPTDSIPVAGDAVEMIPCLPLKAPF
jgi:hypothetical protein